MSCDLCDNSLQTLTYYEIDVCDSSGAVKATVCSGCRTQIESPQCKICGENCPVRSRSDGFTFSDEVTSDGEESPLYTICDDCRKEVLFGDAPWADQRKIKPK